MALEPLTPERRRQQTRDHLLAAAAEVFAERGFDGASIDDVAAVAGFTKGAVYSNFKNKEDLVLALIETQFEEHMERLVATVQAQGDPPEDHLSDFVGLVRSEFDEPLSGLYQQFCVYAMRNPAARAKLAELERANAEAVAKVIEAERQRRGLRPAVPAPHAARIVQALIRGLFTAKLIDPEAVDEAVLKSALDFIAAGATATSEQVGGSDRRPSRRRAPRRRT